MASKYGLLGLLNYGEQSGYDLNRIFTHSINNFWHTQISQIYKELNTMEKDGWLTSHIAYQSDKPNRKVYAITAKGKEELDKWLDNDFVEKEMQIRNAFLIKVFFLGENNPEDNIALFENYRQRNSEALQKIIMIEGMFAFDEMDKEQRRMSIYHKMTATFGHYYHQMCIDWADEMIATIRNEMNI